MLTNGMAESNLCEIKLPEISSSVLLSVLEFLYTATLLDYPPQSWRMSCELIVASRIFLVPQLDVIVRKVMQQQISSVLKDLPKVASLFTEVVRFEVLCDPTDVTVKMLVRILDSNWSDSTFIRSLSEDAAHYLLAYSKGRYEDDEKVSFRENLRFRQVIRWLVHQRDLEFVRAEELVNLIAPDLNRVMSMCKNPGEEQIDINLPEEWNFLQLDEASRNSATRLLSNINFRCMHPVILDKMVEPLKISSAAVIGAFRFHALRRPVISNTLEWELGQSYDTVEQGYVIHATGIGNGVAIVKAAISHLSGLFQWRFILEEIPENFVELGLGNRKSAKKTILDSHILSTCNEFPSMILHPGMNTDYQGASGLGWKELTKSIKRNSSVFFSFNAFERTCCVSIDGQNFDKLWTDLPSVKYYPAVSFGKRGRLRIELLSGFDIL